MERNTFLRSGLTIATFLGSAIELVANSVASWRDTVGFKVKGGEDRGAKPISLFEGDTFYTKVATADSDGSIYVFESTRVKEGGPSHHIHFEQDEWWYVIQGQFLFRVGDVTYQARAGDSVFGPRNVPHSFAKVGEGEGKLLMFFQPAGKMEEFFKKIASGIAKNMTEAEQDKLREAHGFKRIGPPIRDFKKW